MAENLEKISDNGLGTSSRLLLLGVDTGRHFMMRYIEYRSVFRPMLSQSKESNLEKEKKKKEEKIVFIHSFHNCVHNFLNFMKVDLWEHIWKFSHHLINLL
jgi:hypothetical protein